MKLAILILIFDLCGVDGDTLTSNTPEGSTELKPDSSHATVRSRENSVRPVQFRPQVNYLTGGKYALTPKAPRVLAMRGDDFLRASDASGNRRVGPNQPSATRMHGTVEGEKSRTIDRDRFGAAGMQASRVSFLDRLAYLESRNNPLAVGDNGQSRGAYQLSEAAWLDVNTIRQKKGLPLYGWSEAFDAKISREYAAQYLEILSKQFQSANQGHIPTERQALAMYQSGYSGAMRRGILSGGKAK